jgi:regulation of enolase protein 1 (concanavalin A-like superfamily)
MQAVKFGCRAAARLTIGVCAVARSRRRLGVAFLWAIATWISLVPTVSAQTLSGGWTATNIGSPALSGSVTFNGSVFSVSAAGTDIAGTSDQFVFTYRTLAGDGDIVARVNSLGNTHAWAKAGVMIRGALAANAQHVYAAVSPSSGAVMQHRSTAAGSTTDTPSGGGGAPGWVKVERRGSTFRTYRSSDGVAWQQIGTVSMSMPATTYVGLAVTSHNAGQRTSAQLAGIGVLPAGWNAIDVGSPAAPGNTWFSSSTWSGYAGGSGVANGSDQFRYVYQQFTGDVDIVSRVATLQAANSWTRAGLMIRATLAGNSPHVSMFASIGGWNAFQRRLTAGGSTVTSQLGADSVPVWVRLRKRGTTIEAYQSSNGSSWQLVASQTLSLPTNFYVGLAAMSSTSGVASVSWTNTTATGQVVNPTPGPTPQAPTVSLTAPAAGTTYAAPATIAIAATAADADGTVTRVDFRSGSTVIGSDTTSPYTFSWSNVAAGTYSITAVATDNAGATTTSSPVSVSVGSTANQPPLVSLTGPAAGSTFPLLGLLTMTATASDSDGSVARVEFYAGSLLLGSDTSSPYSFTWLNLPLGTFSLMAVAYDNTGAMTSSAQRSITVATAASPSSAVWVPSADHSQVATYVLDVFTAGADVYTANPVATRDLGRPAVVNGECAVDITQFVQGLPAGTYVATVTAIAGGGTARSPASSAFTR